MKTTIILAFAVLVLSAGLYAQTAERMRPGQWSTSTIVGGKTYAASQCISKPDADEMNGDVKKVEAYLRKIIPPEACQITDVKVNGAQVIYTASCGGQAPKVVTTSYHGDSFEGTDSAGGKTTGKLMGACK
jgi:hypothetical protein